MKIVFIIISVYIILLWDFEAEFSNEKKEVKIIYNGLVWVGLDYWSIWKYNSDDKPIKWLDVKTTIK